MSNTKLTDFEKRVIRTEAKSFPSELAKYDYIRDEVHGSLVQYEAIRKELMRRPEAQEMLERLTDSARPA